MGGWDDRYQPLNDVPVFQRMVGHGTWESPLHLPCRGMSAVVHGDLIVMIGGVGVKWDVQVVCQHHCH